MRTEAERGRVWPVDGGGNEAGPLSAVRVLDLSRVLAGPFASMLLGDLGADVIKVEQPGSGDVTRSWGPPFHGDDAAYFFAVNRNRRSLVLDLATAEGQAALRPLAAAADIVLENFLPDQVERLGLHALRAEHPELVWISIRGASSEGPLQDRPTYDVLVQGRSGFMSITGSPGSGPTKLGIPAVDLMAGLHAALAAVAGIYRRDTGHEFLGTQIEVPLFEVALSALANHAANYLIAGIVGGLPGNDHPSVAPYGPLSTSDGMVLVAANSEREFAALCRAADLSELIEDARFADNAARVANRVELAEHLSKRFATEPSAVWLERLSAAAVPSAPINSVGEALTEPQTAAAAIVQRVEHPAGPVEILGSPFRIDGRRPTIRRHPPLLGEHTAEILALLPESDPL